MEGRRTLMLPVKSVTYINREKYSLCNINLCDLNSCILSIRRIIWNLPIGLSVASENQA